MHVQPNAVITTLTKVCTPDAPGNDGLSSTEAVARLSIFGPNVVGSKDAPWVMTELIGTLGNPLVLILLVASVISALTGQIVNACLISLMVLLSAGINFAQTHRSHKTLENLRSKVALQACVCRDGVWTELTTAQIVPGDLIRLRAGDLVPADVQLIDAKDLHVNEASLTGESMPVEKGTTSCAIADPEHFMAFLGSSVVSGFAQGIVKSTGDRTRYGAIADALEKRPPATQFEKSTKSFGLFIMKIVLFLVAFVFLISTILHRDPLESLLFAVALAVGLTPEFLPMILTVTLGQGALKMAGSKVIVKHLPSIQNLGSMDVLCSDKTGTLTSGQTVVENHVDLQGNVSERVFLLAYLNSMHDTGESNSINQAIMEKGVSESPLDYAILHHDHPDVRSYVKLDEIPFDFERRRSSVVVQAGNHRYLITKGSPEGVLENVTHYESESDIFKITDQSAAATMRSVTDLSSRGFRVLAVAWKEIEARETYSASDETNMVLAGLISFEDPPLDDAPELIRNLGLDGVRVVVLTGDSDLTARAVCSKVGIPATRVVTGSEIESMTDFALGQIVEETSVFARLKPSQKTRVILALKNRGHVVGFLGDGINDAPSLHAADVGICVSNASDVAQQSAEIILLEPGFAPIHRGIIEGRKALANVMKYLLMGTSSNFGNMFSMAGAMIFLPYLPMLATQILLNNFLYDLAQISIPSDNVDEAFIRSPQRWDIGLIQRFMLWIGPISSIFDFVTFYVLLRVLHASEEMFHTGWFVESLLTQTLVLFVIRTAHAPWQSRPSLALAVTTLSVGVAATLIPFLPFAAILGFTPLPPIYFVVLAVMVLIYLCLVELVKRKLYRHVASLRPAF